MLWHGCSSSGTEWNKKVAGKRSQGRQAQFQERKKNAKCENIETMKHEFIVASWMYRVYIEIMRFGAFRCLCVRVCERCIALEMR